MFKHEVLLDYLEIFCTLAFFLDKKVQCSQQYATFYDEYYVANCIVSMLNCQLYRFFKELHLELFLVVLLDMEFIFSCPRPRPQRTLPYQLRSRLSCDREKE